MVRRLGTERARPFHELTHAGRVRRLRGLALAALELYDIEPVSLSLLKSSWNTTFRMDTAGGERYVVRISRPGVRNLTDIRSELIWMDVLSRETDIPVPRPVQARNGELVVGGQTAFIPGSRFVSVFHWIGGRRVASRPSERIAELLGETIARLHDHAERFVPPRGFTTARWDRLGSFARNSETSELAVTCRQNQHPALFPRQRFEFFRHEIERVEREFGRLFASGQKPLFLHFDMHLGNVKLVDGRLAVLDFDDSLWGFPIQDLAVSLYYLRYMRGFPPELRDALQRGYCRLREWPEEWSGQMNLLLEARALDMADVMLSLEHPAVRSRLPELLQRIEDQVRELASQ